MQASHCILWQLTFDLRGISSCDPRVAIFQSLNQPWAGHVEVMPRFGGHNLGQTESSREQPHLQMCRKGYTWLYLCDWWNWDSALLFCTNRHEEIASSRRTAGRLVLNAVGSPESPLNIFWLVIWNQGILWLSIYWEEYSQLTNSYFSGGVETTH